VPDSIVQISIDGWRLACRAIAAMPILSGTACLSFFVYQIMVEYLRPAPRSDLLHSTSSSPVNAIRLLIAVHRFVILGEVADRPIWRITLTYRRFASWLVLLSLPWLMPSVADALLGKHHQIAGVIVLLLSLILAAIISLRMMLLLPALAVGMASADWRRAWRLSRGHAWKFLGAQMVGCLPLIVLDTIVVLWFSSVRSAGYSMLFLWAAGASVSQLLMTYLGASIASRLFQHYGAALIERDGLAEGPATTT
jgi:hypothetical protein